MCEVISLMFWGFSIWQSFWDMFAKWIHLCICRSASNLSADKDLGVVLYASVMPGATAFVWGVESPDGLCWAVLLVVLNAGPSGYVADSILIAAGLFWGNSTRCERPFAALLQAPDIYLKIMLYVDSSNPHLLTLLFAFFPLRNLASGLWSFFTIISAPWR